MNAASKLFVISAPSGAGKTTLVKSLIKGNENIKCSTSYTTRSPRINEKEGEDYFFVSDEEFKNLIKNQEFLEYAKVFNNFYGSSKKPVVDCLDKGQNVIFDIDWQGSEQIKNANLKYDLISFFILPPSKKVLFDRLSSRDMKDKNIVEERMKQFDKDITHWKNYDFVVINDDLETCYKQIFDFIQIISNNLLDQKLVNPNPDFLSYTLSKYGLNGLTTMLAMALGPRVRVCGVAPGLVLPSADQTRDQFSIVHDRTPLERGATVFDIASAVRYLVSATAVTLSLIHI